MNLRDKLDDVLLSKPLYIVAFYATIILVVAIALIITLFVLVPFLLLILLWLMIICVPGGLVYLMVLLILEACKDVAGIRKRRRDASSSIRPIDKRKDD